MNDVPKIEAEPKRVVIVGAGPAGLTAALELQSHGITDVTVLESDTIVGGISRTVNHNGNRIDIGGHRFFSKSDWVMNWWLNVLPVDPSAPKEGIALQYQGQTRSALPIAAAVPGETDGIMLVRNRISRIYFNRQFFDYPLKLNVDTLRKLGSVKTITFGVSYVWSKIFPRKPESSLEDFLVNRFGHKLYLQFFKEYTEKVWGVPCAQISASWGAQRIKSLSVLSALWHALKQALGVGGDASQTSLIESFIYPKFGPGQMWEAAARKFVSQGGTLLMATTAEQIEMEAGRVTAVRVNSENGGKRQLLASHVVSTMPIKALAQALPAGALPTTRHVAAGLEYRDFVTVGLLYSRAALPRELVDNWIYIQEPGVKVGRVQVFNNWSPFMVAQPENTVWMGLEFFCTDTDDLWALNDADFKALAQREMKEIGLVDHDQALDALVLRVPKAYPGYFGTAFEQFDALQKELDGIDNLFLVGRNGMHRYNNQDHSMLTAKEAAEQIAEGRRDPAKIWGVNVDDEYHEEK